MWREVMTAVGRLQDMAWYAHLRSPFKFSSSPWHIRPRLLSFSPSLTNRATESRIPWFTSIPSFRQQLARTNKLPSFRERVRCPSVRNQVLVSHRNTSFARGKPPNATSSPDSHRLCCSLWRPEQPTTRLSSGL